MGDSMKVLITILLGISSINWIFASNELPSNVASEWNKAAIQGVDDSKASSPPSVRALAIVDTCVYDAWSAYDDRAVGTQLSSALRRPASERTQSNKEKAISYAAYRALTDLLPNDTDSVYKPLMKHLGYNLDSHSTDIETPEGIGNVACGAVLEFRHHDGANQLGDRAQGPYSDWSRYTPVNMANRVPLHFPSIHAIDPNHWQPLVYVDSAGAFTTQMFASAQWSFVAPFALSSGHEFRNSLQDEPPATYGSAEYRQQAEEMIRLSAHLSDHGKAIAEYWSDSSDGNSVVMRWNEFAQWISNRDHHTLDDDVKMFFTLNNALLDASIATWDIKRSTDSVRPITAIPLLFHGQKIRAWGGPGTGTTEIDGSDWLPYEPATLPTPDSPEYVSEQSAFSAAAAIILKDWTGSDDFGDSVTLAKGSSKIEPGIVPGNPVTLKWQTFQDVVNEAGMAGQYAGITFAHSDLAGQKLGLLVGAKVWTKAQSYFDGTAKPDIYKERSSMSVAVIAGHDGK